MKKFIVIPTYNERNNIGMMVPLIFDQQPSVNIMVVDDNSPDGTAVLVKELQKNFPNLFLLERTEKKGLGKAYIHAFTEILKDPEVEHIVMMDADFSHHPQYINTMFDMLDRGDVIVGSRYIPGGRTHGWELWRRILSRGGNTYCKIITRIPVEDCTGGFNSIRTDVLRKIDLNSLDSSGYAFIMELKHALYKNGATFAEFPIVFANRREGESKMSGHIISEGIIAPWKIRFRS